METIETDLAIVGCGAVGASSAFQAALRGLRVAVIDAAMPTAGTSGACDGFIAVCTKKPGLMMELATASQALFPELVRQLRRETEYHVCGGVMLCEDERVAALVEAQAALVRAHGVAMTFHDRRRMLEIEPQLNPDLFGIYHIPGEANVSPFRWTLALVDGAMAASARTLWRRRPRGFDMAGRRIRALEVDGFRIVAEHYVIAAGVWSGEVGKLVGIDIPVVPRRGELVVTGRGARVAHAKLVSGQYLTVKADPDAVARSPDPVMRMGYGFSLEANELGQCVIGGTRAFVGYDRRATPEGVAVILREAIARIPALAQAPAVRAFAGLRPYVPDGKPIIGRSTVVENLIVATGHEGDGISLSAVTGEIVADLATGRTPRFAIGELSPDRFASKAMTAA